MNVSEKFLHDAVRRAFDAGVSASDREWDGRITTRAIFQERELTIQAVVEEARATQGDDDRPALLETALRELLGVVEWQDAEWDTAEDARERNRVVEQARGVLA